MYRRLYQEVMKIICRECAWEADAVSGRLGVDGLTHADVRMYCREVEPVGHRACKGCDCHHRCIPGRSGLDVEVRR